MVRTGAAGATNDTKTGGGFFANARFPVTHFADIGLHVAAAGSAAGAVGRLVGAPGDCQGECREPSSCDGEVLAHGLSDFLSSDAVVGIAGAERDGPPPHLRRRIGDSLGLPQGSYFWNGVL